APLADPHRGPAPALHLPPGARAEGKPGHDAGGPARARPGARRPHALVSSGRGLRSVSSATISLELRTFADQSVKVFRFRAPVNDPMDAWPAVAQDPTADVGSTGSARG